MKPLITSAFVASMLVSGVTFAAVKITGENSQKVNLENGAISNTAVGAKATAKQNIAANKGKVTIDGKNTQQVSIKNGAVANQAVGALSTAEQNLSTNDGN